MYKIHFCRHIVVHKPQSIPQDLVFCDWVWELKVTLAYNYLSTIYVVIYAQLDHVRLDNTSYHRHYHVCHVKKKTDVSLQ